MHIYIYICIYIHIYIYILHNLFVPPPERLTKTEIVFASRFPPRQLALGGLDSWNLGALEAWRLGWDLGGLGGSFLESILRYFGLQVGGLGSKLEAWEALLESILGLVGVWEAKRQQGRCLLAQGWLGTHKWGQHGSNLSQVGTNLGPTWAQLQLTWS